MIRIAGVTTAVALVWVSTALGQTAGWRFRWHPGQSMVYKVEQTTAVAEVVDGKRTETRSTLKTTKRWQVLECDGKGQATLQLSLLALRIETTSPSGEVMVFDSSAPEKSAPPLREQLGKYVGPALAVVRVNDRGTVMEVKDCKFGTPSRFESEPPFVLTFPEERTKPSWSRDFKITLEPPQGTGEKFAAVQRYICRKVDGNIATVELSTLVPAQPDAVADRIPLLQAQPEGEVYFDFQNGLYKGARLHIEKELKGHQGEGSSYHFASTYVEAPERGS